MLVRVVRLSLGEGGTSAGCVSLKPFFFISWHLLSFFKLVKLCMYDCSDEDHQRQPLENNPYGHASEYFKIVSSKKYIKRIILKTDFGQPFFFNILKAKTAFVILAVLTIFALVT